jgi:uncharacterized membrane protein YdbT with pleckstrin-like domain
MHFAKHQLQEGEEIVLQTNQHIVVLFKPIVLTVLAFIIVIPTVIYLRESHPAIRWLLLALIPFVIYLGWEFIDRANEEYVVTNCRVVKQEGVFTKKSFDAPLDKINNIFHTQTLLGRLGNYGNVGLETASELGLTDFEYIPDPIGFKNTLMAEREKYKQRENKVQPTPTDPSQPISKENIPDLLERLAKLRDSKVITEEEFQESKRKLLGKI